MERTSGSSNVSGYVTIDIYSELPLTMLVVLITSCVSTSVSVPRFLDVHADGRRVSLITVYTVHVLEGGKACSSDANSNARSSSC